MGLKKFPVTSKQGNEYEVDVYSLNTIIGCLWWDVDIYQRQYYTTRLFKNNKYNLIKVYEWHSELNSYNKYIGKYKELAIMAVEKYEEKLEEERQENLRHQNGVKEFLEWDGKIN